MSKLSKFLHKAEKKISNAIPHQHSADRRAANEAAAQQIEYYKTAKDTMEKETQRVESEREAEKTKISQKQIRSARRAYRTPGFMEEAQGGYGETLA